MGKVVLVLFFLGVLALGLIYLRRIRLGEIASETEPHVDRPVAVTSAPRLAGPIPGQDTSTLYRALTVASPDAHSGSLRLVSDEQALIERTRACLASDPVLAE